MSVGLPVGKSDIDNRIGRLALQLRELIYQVPMLKERLDAMTDTELTALGYSTADVTLLRASMVDLALIQQIALGQATLATAYDFRTNTVQTMGIE
jgi:hypothetical protein